MQYMYIHSVVIILALELQVAIGSEHRKRNGLAYCNANSNTCSESGLCIFYQHILLRRGGTYIAGLCHSRDSRVHDRCQHITLLGGMLFGDECWVLGWHGCRCGCNQSAAAAPPGGQQQRQQRQQQRCRRPQHGHRRRRPSPSARAQTAQSYTPLHRPRTCQTNHHPWGRRHI